MPLRFNLTLSTVLLAALLVLLTWASLVQGAAIDRNISPASRDLGKEACTSGVDVSNGNFPRRDGVTFTTKSEGETLVKRSRVGASPVDDRYALAVRTAEEKNEEPPVDGNRDLPRRWYTLVEIADSEESE